MEQKIAVGSIIEGGGMMLEVVALLNSTIRPVAVDAMVGAFEQSGLVVWLEELGEDLVALAVPVDQLSEERGNNR